MKHSLTEYLAYYSIRVLIFVFSLLPIGVSLFIARILGRARYYLDIKHRSVAYKNIKLAFAKDKSPQELRRILRASMENFSQNFVELLRLGKLDERYVDKYIHFLGREHIDQALRQGKGVIFSGIHSGSWEISNAAFALLGYPYAIVGRRQKKNRLLNDLLDSYRSRCGCQVIPSDGMLRQIIERLKNNAIVGLVIDHGGRGEGTLVKFFGRLAYTPTGAVRLALKFKAPIILGHIYRTGGPYHKLIMQQSPELEDTADAEKDLKKNLEKLNNWAEQIVRAHPQEYLWTYKRWKASPEREVVVMTDGSYRDTEAEEAIEKIKDKENAHHFQVKTISIKYKNKLAKALLGLCAFFSSQRCQGCMACARFCLTKDSYRDFIHNYADFVLAGRSLKAVARFLAIENRAELRII